MSTIAKSVMLAAPGSRMTVDEFERFAENRDERFELIDGAPVGKPDMNPDHVWTTEKLKENLSLILPRGWFVRDDKPIAFFGRHPAAA